MLNKHWWPSFVVCTSFINSKPSKLVMYKLHLNEKHLVSVQMFLHKTSGNSILSKSKASAVTKQLLSRDNRKNVVATDADSETDDETSKMREAQEDLVHEEQHRQRAQQLSEEEERLTQEIAQLQGLDIEVETETDGTETDGEVQGETEIESDEGAKANKDMTLEDRYESMLVGK